MSDEQLIKKNEGEYPNYSPKKSSNICWGCDKYDMKTYLDLDFNNYVEYDKILTVDECNTMF